ncbi:MAG: hypothetical protein E2O36_06245 [Proteobacteria bacterium]|nr:MAG: hypothetical protein E2O36_06245 [Pseudomonadota bacterium]
MYTTKFDCHTVRSAVFLSALLCAKLAPASTLVIGYDFEDALGIFENSPASAVAGIEALPWFDQHDSLTNFTGNPGRAIAARSFLDSNTLTLVVNVASGFRATLDGYSFDHLASSSGPATWALTINAVPIASGATPSSFATISGILSLDNITDQLTVELSGFDATSNSGTYRMDNFFLTGTVTPIPIVPAFLLFGSALAFLIPRRRC